MIGAANIAKALGFNFAGAGAGGSSGFIGSDSLAFCFLFGLCFLLRRGDSDSECGESLCIGAGFRHMEFRLAGSSSFCRGLPFFCSGLDCGLGVRFVLVKTGITGAEGRCGMI